MLGKLSLYIRSRSTLVLVKTLYSCSSQLNKHSGELIYQKTHEVNGVDPDFLCIIFALHCLNNILQFSVS